MPTQDSLKTMKSAKAYAAKYVVALAQEIQDWDDTSVRSGGHVEHLNQALLPLSTHQSLSLARSLVMEAVLKEFLKEHADDLVIPSESPSP